MHPATESPHRCVICGEPCSLEVCLTDEKGPHCSQRVLPNPLMCYQTLLLKALTFDKPRISIKPFKIDQPRPAPYGKFLFMKKEPSPKRILAVRCPTCGAAPGRTVNSAQVSPARNRIETADCLH
jgi:hypothetical protein